MVGVIVITHASLASELLSTVRFVIGGETQVKIESVSMFPDTDFDTFSEEIREAISRVDSGDGVLLLTDMFGGTPSNVGLTFLEEGKVEVISGVNLPMLLKLASISGPMTLKAAVKVARKAGRDNIIVASDLISKSAS